ncbi:MAG: hypothetical protein HKN14_08690 [Marinicaulis sp.]|nr:hypothetical protein [Marinicaulis sp.]
MRDPYARIAKTGKFGTAALLLIPARANAQSLNEISTTDPTLIILVGLIAIAAAAVIWAFRVSEASKNQSVHWSDKLAEMEARLEKSDSVLSAHPGLVLVWEDDNETAFNGWGAPKVLGGPAALASLLSFSSTINDAPAAPVDRLLESLADRLVTDEHIESPQTLREKIEGLRRHGVAFSGSISTSDGRNIELDGRVAGGQVALWITDPAVRMAEDGAIVGTIRERATDLHGSHALLERVSIPAWRRDEDLKLVWVNAAFAELVEGENAAAVVRNQIELDTAAIKIARTAVESGKPASGSIRINSNGNRLVLEIIETPLKGGNDAAYGGIAIDKTALDSTRMELANHVEANKKTLDEIPTAVSIFGANQELVYFNRAFQELWEFDDAKLSGRTYHAELLEDLRMKNQLPEPADFTAWKNAQLSLYMTDITGIDSERDGNTPDEIWHLPDARTIKVSKQRHPFGGVMVTYENITEKIDLEARFNTQLKVQEATLDNLAEGVAVFASNGSLRLYNKAFQKLWRLDRNQLIDNPHLETIVEQFSKRSSAGAKIIDKIQRAVTSKSPEDRVAISNSQVPLDDGRILSFGLEPLPDGAMLAHFLDVTDSIARETELKERNAILENADRLKSKFVDHVSYQLRTPLSTIIGFSEMLDDQMFGELNERQKDYVASVLSASYHLRDLINDIIDLAAIDAGKMELATASTDIRTLLESAATFAALKAEDTKVSLKIDCDKHIGAAELDERRIKQVLFNLISNAFTHTNAGDQILLKAERNNDVVAIHVKDTGRGISPTDQAKVFDAFESRGPNAGAGLGLALVKRFVSLHGGWVRLHSDDGNGSTVSFHLPVKQDGISLECERRADPAEKNLNVAQSPAPTGATNPKKRKMPRRSQSLKRSAINKNAAE